MVDKTKKQQTKKEKKKKVLAFIKECTKRILIGLLVFFITLFLIIFAFASFHTFKHCTTASAAELPLRYNPIDYPTANLINPDEMLNDFLTVYTPETNSSESSYRAYRASSSPGNRHSKKMVVNYPAGTYYASLNVLDMTLGSLNHFTIQLYLEDGSIFSSYFNRAITVNSSIVGIVVYFQSNDFTLDKYIVFDKLMFNVGSSAKPYQPYFGSIYDSGFNKGYNDGRNEITLGFLTNSTFDVTYNYGGSDITETGLIPNYSLNSITFKDWWKSHEVNSNDEELEQAYVTLYFYKPFFWADQDVYILGDSLVVSGMSIIYDDGTRSSVDIIESDTANYGYKIAPLRDDSWKSITSFTIQFGNALDTMSNFAITLPNNEYMNGYNNGYNYGFENGKLEKQDEIAQHEYDRGYTAGYNIGFQDGESIEEFSSGSFFRKALDILDVKIFGLFGIGDILKVAVGAMLVLLTLKIFAGG